MTSLQIVAIFRLVAPLFRNMYINKRRPLQVALCLCIGDFAILLSDAKAETHLNQALCAEAQLAEQ